MNKQIEKYIRKFCTVGSVYANLNEAVERGEKDSYRIELFEIEELAKQLEHYFNTEVTKSNEEALRGFVVAFRKYLEDDVQMARSQGVKGFYEQYLTQKEEE